MQALKSKQEGRRCILHGDVCSSRSILALLSSGLLFSSLCPHFVLLCLFFGLEHSTRLFIPGTEALPVRTWTHTETARKLTAAVHIVPVVFRGQVRCHEAQRTSFRKLTDQCWMGSRALRAMKRRLPLQLTSLSGRRSSTISDSLSAEVNRETR
ncbi:hypothetical protein BDN67DRAFT_711756 [Paxillus ammoniavirescens]|nr:hypothetical protein BDN67DRAFT_711756 [Paxillus ammoniavirescens]